MSWRNKRGNKRNRENDDEGNRDSEQNNDEFGSMFDFKFGFSDIDQMIERMFKAARENFASAEGPSNSIYYGYSIVTGPDGKPHVREFGNVKPTSRGTFQRSSREPFVDTVVDTKENKLKIIAEMPGVQREDIKLEVLEDSLIIKAEHGDRQYETNVPINAEIDPSTASATYNNGVLEVNLKLKPQPKSSGYNIKVD